MESFDIMVIGESKGDEAADLSYATYTGSQAMTSVHSNSAEEGYEKIIDYALDAQPNRSREHFAKHFQSLDTAIYVKDFKVVEIVENNGYKKVIEDYDLKPVNFAKPLPERNLYEEPRPMAYDEYPTPLASPRPVSGITYYN